MRPSVHFLFAGFLLIPFVATAQEFSVQDFSDFRIPAHRTMSWTADLGADGARRLSSVDFARSESGGLAGNLSTTSFGLWDSDPHQTFVRISGLASGQRFRAEDDRVFGTDTIASRRSQRSAFERWAIELDDRRYPWATPVGFKVGISVAGFYDQSWDKLNGERVTHFSGPRLWELERLNSQRWRYVYNAGGEVALVIGRVRDATRLYEAWVLEQRLREVGALARPLSRTARQKLAALLYLRGSYSSVVERPARTLWHEIEQILSEDGALSESGLGPYALVRAGEQLFRGRAGRDVLPSSPVLRQVGWFAGPVVTGRHVRDLQRRDDDSFRQTAIDDTLSAPIVTSISSRSEFSRDELLAGVELKFHRPLSVLWQVDANSRLLFPIRKDEDGMEVISAVNLSAIVMDRWLATASLLHERATRYEEPDHRTVRDEWRVGYGLSATYYIEDRFALQVSASEFQQSLEYPFGGRTFDRSANVRLGLTYRLLGSITAPGLAEPVRTPLGLHSQP